MNKSVKYDSKDISSKMVKRLTKYLRVLKDIKKEKDSVNSVELATKMNTTASQVRKDLSTFGEFGVRSKGYDISHLIFIIEHILGIDETNNIILVGHGNMGTMISSNADILGKGFKIIGVFDKDDKKVGQYIPNLNLKVQNVNEIEKLINDSDVKECILAVNRNVAQETAEILIEYGIKAILNLTSKKLSLPDDIASVEVDFSIKLQELNFWKKYKKLRYENN